jgi:hypothetical protein
MTNRVWALANLVGLFCGFVGGVLLLFSLTLEPSEFRLVATSNGGMALCRNDKRVATGFGGPLAVTSDPCPEWEHTGPTVEVKASSPARAHWGLALIILGFVFQLPSAIAGVWSRTSLPPSEQSRKARVDTRSTRAFLRKHAPTIIVLALVACALVFFRHYWRDPARAQTVGALFGFFAAAILVGVTWEYVRINQKSLSLQQAQWEQQNRVVLRFGIKRYQGKAQLWVANIGKTDFLISELLVRMKHGRSIIKNERRIVRSGSRQSLALPENLWLGISLLSTFDVQLRYESQHESGISPARAFTLIVGTNSTVLKIRRGIDGSWFVKCPKCEQLGGSMITENLENFDAAEDRQRAMESDLKATCPKHESRWTDSVEQIRERTEQQKPDQNHVEED